MPPGWKQLSIPDETKAQIETIVEENPELNQYEVVEIAVGIVYEDIVGPPEPEPGHTVTVSPARKEEIEAEPSGLDLKL